MASFSASIRTLGDRTGLPAVVSLDSGRLSIALGDQELGDWLLDEVRLEPTPTGYRMAAEGDQILLEMSDTTKFEEELDRIRKPRVGIPKVPSPEKILEQVDKGIAVAEKRWGSLLPEWMFTRMMFGIVCGALLLTVILPGLVSVFLLICGLLVVLFGAVVFTDQVLAAKWLPGRMAPMHVLIFGVTFLMFGVLLGVVSK